MMEFWIDFFSLDPTRPVEGFWSWQHLTLITSAMILAFVLAIILGSRTKGQLSKQLQVLKITAVLLVGMEITRDIGLWMMNQSAVTLLEHLPLYFCGIPVIFLPIGAFSKGKLQKASFDMVFMFGFIGGLLGTYLASNIYGVFPLMHFDPLTSLATHTIAAFASLYIGFSHSYSLKKDTLIVSLGVLLAFILFSLGVNYVNGLVNLHDNYMFLTRSDGTPFGILEGIFGVQSVGYTVSVTLLMVLYVLIYYLVASIFSKKNDKSL